MIKRWTGDTRSKENQRLVAAIRRFTVDMPDDQPNGEAERQLLRIEALCVRELRSALAEYCSAVAADTKELREAASAYFGLNFKEPPAS